MTYIAEFFQFISNNPSFGCMIAMVPLMGLAYIQNRRHAKRTKG